MATPGSAERRAFYRLRYPELERPLLWLDNSRCHVVEISESGMRLHRAGWEREAGEKIMGTVRFHDGEAVIIYGVFLRIDGDEVILQLEQGISLRRMLDEQRRLIHLYPLLFERG